jgi:hypothetical protein
VYSGDGASEKGQITIVNVLFKNKADINKSDQNGFSPYYQVSVYLAKWFQRRRFLEIDQSETRIACDVHVC